jgi:hypothetical protein
MSTVRAVLVFAILFAAGMSRALQVVYDVSGGDPFVPSDQTGSFDSASATAPFAPGSSLTLEFDANGDGVPGDVTVVTSRLVTHSVYDTPDFGAITKDSVGVIQGGLATLSPAPYDGQYLHWTSAATYSVSGTYTVDGEQASLVPSSTPISLLDWALVTPFNQDLRTALWYAPCVAECTPLSSIFLGQSDFDATFGIGGSESFRFYLRPVPEPAALLLGAVALALLARPRLRRR